MIFLFPGHNFKSWFYEPGKKLLFSWSSPRAILKVICNRWTCQWPAPDVLVIVIVTLGATCCNMCNKITENDWCVIKIIGIHWACLLFCLRYTDPDTYGPSCPETWDFLESIAKLGLQCYTPRSVAVLGLMQGIYAVYHHLHLIQVLKFWNTYISIIRNCLQQYVHTNYVDTAYKPRKLRVLDTIFRISSD